MSKFFANEIHNVDCVEGMKATPKGVVDLVITDPPFAIDFKARRTNYNRTQSRILDGYSEVSADDQIDLALAADCGESAAIASTRRSRTR